MSANNEKLSALMDAETSEFETRRVLKDLEGDPDLADTWRRYHLARSLMREQRVESTIDISASVMASISEMDAAKSQTELVSQSNPTRLQGFWKASASMAVAASVTFAVLLGVQNYSSDPSIIAPTTQAGVIQRSAAISGVMPTSLAPVAQQSEDGQSISLIRLSKALSSAIDAHRALVPADVQSGIQATWLPDGYKSIGAQVSDAGVTQIYGSDSAKLSVSVQSVTAGSDLVSPGVYTQGDLLAYGEQRGDIYVSVVGALSLTEAQQVLNSLTSSVQ